MTRKVKQGLAMKPRYLLIIGLAVLPLLVWTAVARPGRGEAQGTTGPAAALVASARSATERFKSADAARAAGYGLFHGCVSGPQEGAMGIHLVNGTLVGDGALDPMRPEALLYEVRNGQRELLGVEYVVIAEAWHAQHEAPPVLGGQLFNYVSSPNRYGIPAFYELHVWAWKLNPRGTFADFNPNVSCDEYTAEDTRRDVGH
jgi:hypothetical protein